MLFKKTAIVGVLFLVMSATCWSNACGGGSCQGCSNVQIAQAWGEADGKLNTGASDYCGVSGSTLHWNNASAEAPTKACDNYTINTYCSPACSSHSGLASSNYCVYDGTDMSPSVGGAAGCACKDGTLFGYWAGYKVWTGYV